MNRTQKQSPLTNQFITDKSSNIKSLAVLIDPDNISMAYLDELMAVALQARVRYFFVGGSLLMADNLPYVIEKLKTQSQIPVLLFPGNNLHIDTRADGLLFLSLISGRNPDLLIGQHVAAAPMLFKSGLEILPTGYMLIDGGLPTAVSYISNTTPIPSDKPSIAVCTAMAGEMLGLKLIYMDAGSGARQAVPARMVAAVAKAINVPLIVGGGLRTPIQIIDCLKAGADTVVVGNLLEKQPEMLKQLSSAIDQLNAVVSG